MELIGDYSENPLEELSTDIPMLSICRTIEIDLLQMLNETDLPKPIQPIDNVLCNYLEKKYHNKCTLYYPFCWQWLPVLYY